jgi:signal transduction histidine kinase
VARSRRIGEVAVFRDDFLVLYSTIPEFIPGLIVTRDNILPLFDEEIEPFTYILTSRNMVENRIYVLTNATYPQARSRVPPFFVPFFYILILFLLLTIFAIGMSITITRTITRSVQVLENATRRISEGELDFNVDVKGSNEITSLTKSLNKMRHTLKEEELRRSRFIMGITHDLKTPLALIKGYAEALEDGITEDPASRSGAVKIIASKADQLEGMINDLIDFVRMETGEWRTQLNQINLTAFLKELAKSYSTDVALLHHTLVYEIALPDLLSVSMDERLALRALENLINNAIRHTPAGSIIRLDAVQTRNAVELSVSDNGPGIDKEDLPNVFEMFYRGSLSRREQGMGMGLAVVKWVTNYHGWSISVSAAKGEGTNFTITIPIA